MAATPQPLETQPKPLRGPHVRETKPTLPPPPPAGDSPGRARARATRVAGTHQNAPGTRPHTMAGSSASLGQPRSD